MTPPAPGPGAELGGVRGGAAVEGDRVQRSGEDERKLRAARSTHKDTTRTAKRSVKKLRATRDAAARAAGELERQTEHLEAVQDNLDNMRNDVDRSRSALKYLMLFCVCFKPPPAPDVPAPAPPRPEYVVEPVHLQVGREAAGKSSLAGGGGGGGDGGRSGGGGSGGGSRVWGNASKEWLPDVGEARVLKLAEGDAELNAETKKQDTYLDEMSGILGEIQEIGYEVQSTIVKQNAMIDDIQNESDSLRGDLHDITHNSKVMRKVKVKMAVEKEKKTKKMKK